MENKEKCECHECQCESESSKGVIALISGHRRSRNEIEADKRAEAEELKEANTSTTFFERLKAKIKYKLRAND